MNRKPLGKINFLFSVVFLTLFFITKIAAASVESYYSGDSVNIVLLDEPYKEKSAQHLKELAEIKKIQKHLKKSDIEEAAAEREFIPELIANKVDARLNRHSFPKLYHLLDRTGATSRTVTDHFKNHWQYTRPYLYDTKIKAMIPQSAGYSYPSGHTTGSQVYTDILALLMPENKAELKAMAEKIGWHRVQVGMHYPQDVVAGKELAKLIVGGLLQNKEFKSDLAKARDELKAAKITN